MSDNNKGYSRNRVDKHGKEKLDIYNTDGHPINGDNHSSFHATKTEDGEIKMKFTNRETGEKTETKCYLTTACMRHYLSEFDDKCYELTTLRWFRDTFVLKDDINYYYEVAPIIVKELEKIDHNNSIYDYIYNYVISVCVKAIEMKNYKFAYERYKKSVYNLEKVFLNK